jgi:hypothetical protein
VVFFPTYEKAANFCVWVMVCLFEGLVGYPVEGCLCVWIGNQLFDMMPRMIFTSSLYSPFCTWYVLICCVEIIRLRICVGLGVFRNV